MLRAEMMSEDQLLAELQQASAGLLFMSEEDHPFQVICWKNLPEVTKPFLRRIAQQLEDALVETESLERLLGFAATEQDWHRPQDREIARRYQSLLRLLKENLEGVTAYRIGVKHIAVYIIGKGAEGSWLGLSTQALET